jgi:hypothetical protein
MTRSKIITDAIVNILDSRGSEGLPSSYEQGLTCRLETISTGEIVPTLTIRPLGVDGDFSTGEAIQLVFANNSDIYIRKGSEKWNDMVRLVTEVNERPEDGKIYIDNARETDGNGSSHNPFKDCDKVALHNGDNIIFTSSPTRYSELKVDYQRNVIISSRKGKSKITDIRLAHKCGETEIKDMIADNIEVYTNSDIFIEGCKINSLIISGNGVYNIVNSHITNLYVSGKAEVMLDRSDYNKSEIGPKAGLFRITQNIEEIK